MCVLHGGTEPPPPRPSGPAPSSPRPHPLSRTRLQVFKTVPYKNFMSYFPIVFPTQMLRTVRRVVSHHANLPFNAALNLMRPFFSQVPACAPVSCDEVGS